MNYAQREAIFSKDFLDIDDLGVILGLGYQMAAKRMRDIKRKHDRLGIQGKIHVQDYLDYFSLPPDRYKRPDEEGGTTDGVLQSVCAYATERKYG